MNKMKRIFSLVLAFSIVLGTFGAVVPAFAAEEETKVEETKVETPVVETKDTTEILTKVPKDVIGTEYEEAITRLVAFGIVGGYPDGTYKPEDEINRAQFAKLVVEALGLRDAVPAAQGKATGFSDVQPNYWAAGYINVASGQGLLKGFPDGTFRPAKNVNYAEALTMLVRTLGYQDEFLPGNWPGNYVAKAADVGITSGVKLPATVTEGGKRGLVALLVNNTLDAEVVKVGKYVGISGIEYTETDITLLKDKLNISKHEDTRIFADKIVDDGLRTDEVSVRFLEKTRNDDAVRVSYKEDDAKTFRTKKDVNPRPFIGEEVTTYLTDRDEVIFLERENDDRANFDYVEENKAKDRVSLVKFDKDYRFSENADIYVFNSSNDQYESKSAKDIDATKMLGKVGKFVVRNNEVVYAEVQDSTEATPWLVVMENDKDVLKGINKNTEDFKLDLTKGRNYDEILVFDTNGNKLEVKDIKKGNLVYAQQQDYDGDDVAVVTVVRDNEVTGEVGKFRLDRVEIGTKTYKAMRYKDSDNNFQAYYSVDGLDDIKDWDNGELEDDLDDAYKKEVTAYLDATGKIAFLTTDVDSVSGYKFGVITRMYTDGDRVRVFTTIDGKEGKDTIFKADKEDNLTNPLLLTKTDLVKGTKTKFDNKDLVGRAVKFKLNKDGEISKDEFYVMDHNAVQTMAGDFGKDTMDMNLGSYAVNNNVDIIDAAKVEAKLYDRLNLDGATGAGGKEIKVDDFAIAKWDDMKEDKISSEIKVYVFPKKNRTNEVDGLVFVGEKGANTGSDEVAVYVIKKDRKADDIIVEYVEYGKGKETKVVDNATNLSDVVTEKAYVGKHKSNGKIELVNLKEVKDRNVAKDTSYYTELGNDNGHEDYTVYRNAVVNKTGSQFEIKESGRTFVYSGSPVTYFEDKVKDAREGDLVDLIVEKGVRVRVVGINKEGKGGTGTTPQHADGKVKFINTDKKAMIITEGGKDKEYFATENTRVYDENGNPVNMGSFAPIVMGDLVKVEGNKVTIITRGTDITAADTFKDNHKVILAKEVKNIVTGDKQAIENALAAYEVLTDAQKALLKSEKALLDKQLAKANAAGEMAIVQPVIDAIDAIDLDAINENSTFTTERNLYDALTDAQKALVTNYDKLVKAEEMVAEYIAVDAAKAALTTLGFEATNGNTHAQPKIAKPADHANKATYTITKVSEPVATTTGDDIAGAKATGTDPVTITRAANEFKFEITVTIQKGDVKDTKVFEVTVPAGTAAVTVTVAP